MKLVTYVQGATGGSPRIGVQVGEQVLDLAAAATRGAVDPAGFANMLVLIQAGRAGAR